MKKAREIIILGLFLHKSYGYYIGYSKNIVDENSKEGYYTITARI